MSTIFVYRFLCQPFSSPAPDFMSNSTEVVEKIQGKDIFLTCIKAQLLFNIKLFTTENSVDRKQMCNYYVIIIEVSLSTFAKLLPLALNTMLSTTMIQQIIIMIVAENPFCPWNQV